MKPFDLEAAKRGEPLITRDGREAHFIAHTDKVTSAYKVLTIINGDWHTFTEQGERHSGGMSTLDLFMAPRKRTVWANLYAIHDTHGKVHFHPSQEEADDAASHTRVGGRAWPLEIEE